MNWNRSVLGALATSAAIPATVAVATLYNCYVLVPGRCCDDFTIPCSHSDGGTPPVITNWPCWQYSDNSGHNILFAFQVNTGRFRDEIAATYVGKCKITPRACGTMPGSCKPGTAYELDCWNSVLYGTCPPP